MEKSITNFSSLLIGSVLGAVVTKKIVGKKVRFSQQMSDKHLALFLMMNQWVKIRQRGKELSSFFEKKGYKEIAIYGMSYVGQTLADELLGSNINIKYGIDRKAENVYVEFDVVSPEDILNDVDAIIVTSITFFYEIEEQLSRKINCPIISLEDVLNSM